MSDETKLKLIFIANEIVRRSLLGHGWYIEHRDREDDMHNVVLRGPTQEIVKLAGGGYRARDRMVISIGYPTAPDGTRHVPSKYEYAPCYQENDLRVLPITVDIHSDPAKVAGHIVRRLLPKYYPPLEETLANIDEYMDRMARLRKLRRDILEETGEKDPQNEELHELKIKAGPLVMELRLDPGGSMYVKTGSQMDLETFLCVVKALRAVNTHRPQFDNRSELW